MMRQALSLGLIIFPKAEKITLAKEFVNFITLFKKFITDVDEKSITDDITAHTGKPEVCIHP